jgi:hypothetical protein
VPARAIFTKLQHFNVAPRHVVGLVEQQPRPTSRGGPGRLIGKSGSDWYLDAARSALETGLTSLSMSW